jgi:hypothetical protein
MQKVATVNSALRSGIQASGFAFHTFRYAGPIYARDLLTKDYGVKYTKPNYFPTLYNVLNGNQE